MDCHIISGKGGDYMSPCDYEIEKILTMTLEKENALHNDEKYVINSSFKVLN